MKGPLHDFLAVGSHTHTTEFSCPCYPEGLTASDSLGAAKSLDAASAADRRVVPVSCLKG